MESKITKLSPTLHQANSENYRSLPHDIDVEQGFLGALLINNQVLERTDNFLLEEHFFDPVHARIFHTSSKFISNGQIASPVTLKTYFEHDEGLEQLGGTSYLTKLATKATTIINAKQYGQIIYELSLRRNLIDLGEDIVNTAFEAEIELTPIAQIETAERKLYEMAEAGHHQSGFLEFHKALADSITMAELAYKRDGKLSGISSGFKGIDERLGGLQKSDLLILAGRPAMGKTALATNIAFNIAQSYAKSEKDGQININEQGKKTAKNGAVVGFFSLEMSADQIATRILAEQTEISSSYIRKGDIRSDQYDMIYEKSRELQSIPLYIDHTGAIPISTLVARARRLKREHNLGIIIIDYLQLIRTNDRSYRDNRVQEISLITQSLKALAKDLEIPVIALSQLSRQVESREDKRPQLSDLRESGSIEQDADIVMFVYREEYYMMREQPKEDNSSEMLQWQQRMDDIHGIAEVIIGKNRHGPVDTIKLSFEAQYTRFRDLAEDEYIPERIK